MDTEDLLARALAEIRQGEGSLDEFLAQYPARRSELEPLLRLALRLETLREAPSAQPSPSARTRMRDRVMADLPIAADEELQAQPAYLHRNGYHREAVPVVLAFPGRSLSRSHWWNLGRRAAAMAASLVLMMGAAGVGTVSAAWDSLPGDLLYPVKTAAEQAQVALTFSDAERAGVYMALAERRLWELSRVSEIGKTEAASEIAAAYDRHLAGAASSATRATIEGKAPLGPSLEEQLARQQQALQELRQWVPEPVQEAVAVALGAANQAASQIAQTVMAPDRTGGPAPVDTAASTAPAAAPTIIAPSASAAPLTPMAGPGTGGAGVLSGPTATGGEVGAGFPTDKDKTSATPAPSPTDVKGGLLPVAPPPAGPTRTGTDGAGPVAPVTASDVPPSTTAPAQPGASTTDATGTATGETGTQAAGVTATATPGATTATATADKPSIISTPPAPTGTPVTGKDGGLTTTTTPSSSPRPRIVTPIGKPAP